MNNYSYCAEHYYTHYVIFTIFWHFNEYHIRRGAISNSYSTDSDVVVITSVKIVNNNRMILRYLNEYRSSLNLNYDNLILSYDAILFTLWRREP